MGPFNTPQRRNSGYSLIEILVVLVIVGILSMAYVVYRPDKNAPAVRGAMNSIYGTLVDARTLARGTGNPVTLTPTGGAASAVLTYVGQASGVAATGTTLTPPTGVYTHATDPSVARFCIVDLDGSSTAGAAALASLKSSLSGSKASGTSIFNSTIWNQSLFNQVFTYNSDGTASIEGYVLVVGATGGAALPNGPVGILLVNTSGNIYRYYRSNSSSTWVRL